MRTIKGFVLLAEFEGPAKLSVKVLFGPSTTLPAQSYENIECNGLKFFQSKTEMKLPIKQLNRRELLISLYPVAIIFAIAENEIDLSRFKRRRSFVVIQHSEGRNFLIGRAVPGLPSRTTLYGADFSVNGNAPFTSLEVTRTCVNEVHRQGACKASIANLTMHIHKPSKLPA